MIMFSLPSRKSILDLATYNREALFDMQGKVRYGLLRNFSANSAT